MSKNYWEADVEVSVSSKESSNKSDSVADITIIVDRSGSMSAIRDAMVAAVNEFISKVKSTPGEGYWTLICFDDRDSACGSSEKFPHTVFSCCSDNKVPEFTSNQLQPRGGTALVDAVCSTIQETKERIRSLPDSEQKRRRVLMVIVTDGQENSSKEYSSVKMREMVARRQSKDGWEFLYLGANQDAFAEAGKYSMNTGFNYMGMGGVVTSGMIASGQVGNYSAGGFEMNSGSISQALVSSGAFGAQVWKTAGQISVNVGVKLR